MDLLHGMQSKRILQSHFKLAKAFVFWYDVIEDRCYSVSTDELLTPEDITKRFAEVGIEDRKEVESFGTNKCFRLNQRDSRAYNRIDGTWVRKWLNR